MDAEHAAENSIGTSAETPCGSLRYLARQPILDVHGTAHGYELLFRSGPDETFRGDTDAATRIMIDNAIIFGLRKLTGGTPAFVNCTLEAILQDHVRILPPGMAILELPPDTDAASDLVSACAQLKNTGYKLALDRFTYKPELRALIPYADYIKIDYLSTSTRERQATIAAVKEFKKILIAERIETHADFEKAQSEGFTLFQGYYFCRPVLLTKRQLPANKLAQLRLLRMLQDDPLDLARVTREVELDPGLAFRLLQLVNSPLCHVREEVGSIQTALMIAGDNLFRRLATLAISTQINTGRSVELLRTAFVRARFCELASELTLYDPKEQYMLGLFSLLPAMLQVPMEEAIRELPLRSQVRSALLGEPGQMRYSIDWVESHERADWEREAQIAECEGLTPERLQYCYNEAVLWADEMLWAAGAR